MATTRQPPEQARAAVNKAANRRRAALVAAGFCGQCRSKRGKLAWLCDGCAELHRLKQRLKYHGLKALPVVNPIKGAPMLPKASLVCCRHCKGAGFFAR